MLVVNDIEVAYGELKVLYGINFSAHAGTVLCLAGRNGAGKTTTLRSIMGLLPLKSGNISMNGDSLSNLPAHEVPKRGVAYVPQGRGLFTELTVAQNLEIGLMVRDTPVQVKKDVLELFPRLTERLSQRAETLSGGEQQMLAMARAMCMEPSIILLDEPTEGLQPSMTQLIREVILKLRNNNVAVVLVEQHVDAILSVADNIAFIENGRIAETLPIKGLTADSIKFKHYLGIS